jgi:hypothetical protein
MEVKKFHSDNEKIIEEADFYPYGVEYSWEVEW